MSFRTYRSKETVKARKVTEKDGETVVTTGGPVLAPKGAYVVESDNGLRVMEAEAFTDHYGASSASRKRTGSRKSASASKAGSKASSAASRVKSKSKNG